LRRVAPQDVAVERIEGEKILVELPRRPDLRKSTALRRLRIDVAEVGEIGRVGEIAERRQPVAFDFIGGAGAIRARERGCGRDGSIATKQFYHAFRRGRIVAGPAPTGPFPVRHFR
jgi:hypothetical protein